MSYPVHKIQEGPTKESSSVLRVWEEVKKCDYSKKLPSNPDEFGQLVAQVVGKGEHKVCSVYVNDENTNANILLGSNKVMERYVASNTFLKKKYGESLERIKELTLHKDIERALYKSAEESKFKEKNGGRELQMIQTKFVKAELSEKRACDKVLQCFVLYRHLFYVSISMCL